MTDWDGILRQTVGDATQAAQAAIDDLNAITSEISKSISQFSSGKVTLDLAEVSNAGQFVIVGGTPNAAFAKPFANYIAALSSDGRKQKQIARFGISPTGYPIYLTNEGYIGTEQLNNRDQLEEYFRQQLSNPNSALVVSLMLMLRGIRNI